jgi:hypothetical protein
MVDEVIDIVPEEVIVEEPQKVVWRFVGNHLSINASHLAYVLNIIGVNVPSETYERMPDEIKKHFMAVKV